MLTPQVLLWIAVASTVAGTFGGALEKACTPGGTWYRVGVFFASLGVDLVSLRKLGAPVAVGIVLILQCVSGPVACTSAQQQQAKVIDKTALDITNAVCSIAPLVPVDGPLVTLICQLVDGAEGVALVAIDGLPVVDADAGATTVKASQLVPVRSVLVQVPREQVAGFLARHAGRLAK